MLYKILNNYKKLKLYIIKNFDNILFLYLTYQIIKWREI